MSRITLQVWLERTYEKDCRPALSTARSWAKNGKLDPPASKEGRTYYVEEHTRYNADPTPNPSRPKSLLDRVRASEAARRKEQRPPA